MVPVVVVSPRPELLISLFFALLVRGSFLLVLTRSKTKTNKQISEESDSGDIDFIRGTVFFR